jgi:integrase/recombinase XerD
MSRMSDELEHYLAVRRSFGFDLRTFERVLRKFIAFAQNQGTDYITSKLFLRWKDTFGSASMATWSTRLGMVCQFSLWLNGVDSRNEVLSRSLLTGKQRRTRPYIYSDQEILQIVDGAARLHSVNGIRALTYSTFFGLIAVTGLRISEAIALDCDDVDLTVGILKIRHGKLGKERIVPISKSSLKRIATYAKERDRLLGCHPTPFFVSDSGTRLTDCTARYNFACVCQQIGLRPVQRFNRHGRGPRIHDLRHTFAVHTLLRWYRAGMDPDREMLKLSIYLGHTKPDNTYWYIEAIPELLELASHRATQILTQGEGK